MAKSTGRFSLNVGKNGVERDDKRVRDHSKTLVHPMQSNWVRICSGKEHYDQVFSAAKAESLKHYMSAEQEGVPGSRLDLGRMLHDCEDGKLPPAMQIALKTFKDARLALSGKAKPTDRLIGTELSPETAPMRPGLQPVIHKISDKKDGEFIVSRDVWGQLTQRQAEELTDNPGIHQCSTISTSKVSEANPTGVWTEFEKDLGDKVVVDDAGPIRKVYSFDTTIEAEVRRVVPEPVLIESPKHYEEVGIPEGTPIKISHEGVEMLDSKDGVQSFKAKAIQRKINEFRFADPVGRHLDDISIKGEICDKWDGIFHYAKIEDGRLEIKTRNGIRYRANDVKCCDMEFAFEQNSGAAKILYVRFLNHNTIPLAGPVHDFLNRKLKLKITGSLLADTELEFDWQTDGKVIKNMVGHFFLKPTKTVDITQNQALRLRFEGYYVEEFSPERPGQIWELDISTRGLTGPRPRLRELVPGVMVVDKVLPNKYIRIKYAMAAPTWAAYKRHHGL